MMMTVMVMAAVILRVIAAVVIAIVVLSSGLIVSASVISVVMHIPPVAMIASFPPAQIDTQLCNQNQQ